MRSSIHLLVPRLVFTFNADGRNHWSGPAKNIAGSHFPELPCAHPSAKFCPNRPCFRGDIREKITTVFQDYYNIDEKAPVAYRRGRAAAEGKDGGDKRRISHLTTVLGRQNCSPRRAPITHATRRCELVGFEDGQILLQISTQIICPGLVVFPSFIQTSGVNLMKFYFFSHPFR